MASHASVSLLGHITEPQTKYLEDGTHVVNFSLAVTTKRRESEITSWYRCAAFGNQAKGLDTLAERGLFVKGALVMVTGNLTLREYTANDGSNRTSADVNTNAVQFCSLPRNAGGDRRDDARQDFQQQGEESQDVGDVPF